MSSCRAGVVGLGPAAALAVALLAAPVAAQDARVEQRVSEREPVVSSGSDQLSLTISGQINRAFNVVDDGNQTKFYAVDNDVSNTRFRLVGEATIDDWTFNSVLEQALSANNSYDVSQDNENAGDFLDTRKAELIARNDRFGAFFGGKGSGASDDVSEYDLSLVALAIMYSGVADPVGGIQFTENGNLTGQTIGDAYLNFDGLGADVYAQLRYFDYDNDDGPAFDSVLAATTGFLVRF